MIDLETFPDRIALSHIQNALWGLSETRGAAIMVGAGLSRAAERSAGDAAPIPLWFEMSEALRAQLYPKGGGPSDPLRLAEEYEAALGRPALNELIRTKIDDVNLKFGNLHKDLLALPWNDVLTTNWDTLLERTAQESLSRFYTPVLTVNDISRASAPRIIKLHGSLPSHTPFIFTEEDFRSYPSRFAPFVNLAQQVLMENVLCLIGFSGDDPNFLNWSGWVRDHLGENAPTIFLIGALDLSSSKRKMLEQRRVSPIDFGPSLASVEPYERHAKALSLFVSLLTEAKPWPAHRWPEKPSKREEHDETNEELLKRLDEERRNEDVFARWRAERESYPGWVVCPATSRHLVRRGIHEWRDQAKKYEALKPEDRIQVLFDYAWRLQLTLNSIPNSIMMELVGVIEKSPEMLSRNQRHEVAYWCLREAREGRNFEKFEHWRDYIFSDAGSPFSVYAKWEEALRARDELEFEQLNSLVLSIEGEDPIWAMRRAALLSELNKDNEVYEITLQAVKELRRRAASDRNSIWIASRLSWASFLTETLGFASNGKFPRELLLDRTDDAWPAELTRVRCNPWDERKSIEEEIDTVIKNLGEPKFVSEESFDLGHSRSSERGQGWGVGFEKIRVGRFVDQTGVPRRTDFWNLLNGLHRKWIEMDGTETVQSVLRLVLHPIAARDYDKILNRKRIANLDQQIIDAVIPKVFKHLRYCLERAAHFPIPGDDWRAGQQWSSMAASSAELISRLVIRFNPEDAKEVVKDTFEILRAGEIYHVNLWQPLGNLLKRGLERLDDAGRQEFLLDAIELPLTPQKAPHSRDEWPDVTEDLPFDQVDRTENEARWQAAISKLLDGLGKSGQPRKRATMRLLKLHEAGALSSAEQGRFATSLWASINPVSKMPEGTDLFSSVFLNLPEPENGHAKKTFETHILHLTKNNALSADQIVSSSNAAAYLPKQKRCYLSNDEAKKWLAKISLMKRSARSDEFRVMPVTDAERKLGWCLANAVFPRLTSKDISKEEVEGLLAEDAEPSIVIGLPQMARIRPKLLGRVLKRVRAGLVSDDQHEFFSACAAVHELGRLQKSQKKLDSNPADLYSEIASAIFLRKPTLLLNAIEVAKWLAANELFSKTDLERIEIGLSYLLVELDYSSDRSAPFEHLFLVRRRTVELARILNFLGNKEEPVAKWLEVADLDPMPEVRAALKVPINKLMEAD